MNGGSIVQVTLWNSPYLGEPMLSALGLADEVRKKFGLATHFVLAPRAEAQPWLGQLDEAGVTWSILPDERGAWREHLDGVVRDRRAALIHSHFTEADLESAAAAAAAGIPCVWHLRTGFIGYPLVQRVKDLFKMRIVARRRVAAADHGFDLAGRAHGPARRARERIKTVPNAIVTERFARTYTSADRARAARSGPRRRCRPLYGLVARDQGRGRARRRPAGDRRAPPAVNALLVGERADARRFFRSGCR